MYHRNGGVALIVMCLLLSFPKLFFAFVLFILWPEMFWWMFTVFFGTLFIMLCWQVYKWYKKD